MALGINCRGSGFCQYGPSTNSPDITSIFVSLATGTIGVCSAHFFCGPIADTDMYAPGAHIVCMPQGTSFLGGICAFTQGNITAAGTSGHVIKQKLKQLHEHGCTLCGSVPLSAEGNDPDEEGILTVNYVRRRVCSGVCQPAHYFAKKRSNIASTDGTNHSDAGDGVATA
ncbi:MAG: hypothetical protein Q9181_006605 [Wetmoreana brouardii]